MVPNALILFTAICFLLLHSDYCFSNWAVLCSSGLVRAGTVSQDLTQHLFAAGSRPRLKHQPAHHLSIQKHDCAILKPAKKRLCLAFTITLQHLVFHCGRREKINKDIWDEWITLMHRETPKALKINGRYLKYSMSCELITFACFNH